MYNNASWKKKNILSQYDSGQNGSIMNAPIFLSELDKYSAIQWVDSDVENFPRSMTRDRQ